MRAAEQEQVSTKAGSSRHAASRHVGSRGSAYRSHLQREEQQVKTKRTAVVFSLFLSLLAAALLVGGRTLIDPLLQRAAEDRKANQVGEIVFGMPDGRFCRHLSFDNRTAEVVEGGVEQCSLDRGTGNISRAVGFRWGAH